MAEGENIKWHDIANWGVEGKGWDDTERRYERLPARAKGVVTQSVWDLSHMAIGLCSHFVTDSTKIYARWTMQNDMFGEPNFNVAGFSGVDLYGDDNGVWRWLAAPNWKAIQSKTPSDILIDRLPKEPLKCRLYLPMRNPVDKVEIGVEEGASFEPLPPRRGKELVYYGTSIAHGAYASRSGMAHPHILARRLDLPLVNLGFSGNAKMEPELAKLIAELDAAAFVLDALPNMDPQLVHERAETFIRTICEKHPDTPVILVEDHQNLASWRRLDDRKVHEKKWKEFARVYRKLVKEGARNLSYVKGSKLFGTDGEASVDGVHPSDLGMMRMADILEPAVRRALEI
jgi:hypothetical protein